MVIESYTIHYSLLGSSLIDIMPMMYDDVCVGCLCLEECVSGTCTCPMNGLYIDGNYSWSATTIYDYGNATSSTCRVWPSTQSPSGTFAMTLFLTFIPLSPGISCIDPNPLQC